MKFEIPFLRARRIRRKAAEWHLELFEGTTPERRAEFEAWLAADPEHAREYRIFSTYSELSPELTPPTRDRRRSLFWQPAYAFALAMVVVVGGALLITNRESGTAYAAVTNRGPAIRMVRLADGSRVILDKETSLSVEFRPTSREVEVHFGRARFKVAPDPKRPFIVSSDQVRVTSNGGEFDVDVRGSDDRVTSRQGTVNVTTEDDRTGGTRNVPSGEAVRVGDGKMTPISIARDERLWPLGSLWFDQTPLSEVVAMANRVGGPPIRVSDASIGAIKVTAALDIRDTGALARKLAATFDLTVRENPDGILLMR
jgi:transmembrane sensor